MAQNANEEHIRKIVEEVVQRVITSNANGPSSSAGGAGGVFQTIDAAVQAATRAQQQLVEMTLEERTRILHKVADGINDRFDEFLEAECQDTGKPKSMASHIDIPRGAANFKVFADMIKNVPTESFEMPTPDGTGALNYAVRRPKGVIGVIIRSSICHFECRSVCVALKRNHAVLY